MKSNAVAAKNLMKNEKRELWTKQKQTIVMRKKETSVSFNGITHQLIPSKMVCALCTQDIFD